MSKIAETPLDQLENKIEVEAKELKREFRHFERFRNENSLLLSVFVLGLATLVIVNTMFWVQVSRSQARQEIKAQTTAASVRASTSQQTAYNFAMSARASNVAENVTEDRAFPLGEDETLLTLNITITNKTNKTQHLIPVTQFYIRSDQGDYSVLHASLTVTNPLASQDLKPGHSASGQLSFAVPKRIASPMLHIDTMWDDATPLVIDVLH